MKNLRPTSKIVLALLVVVPLGACDRAKSESPLSPLIAGPIAGVEITTPVLLEPGMGQQFRPDQQPLALLIENPSTNSPRPFQLTVEVAADAGFTTKVHSNTALTPGTANGRTTYQLPEPLAVGRVYYWRAKANDGANESVFSPARAFEVLEPVVIGAPTPVSPVGGLRTLSRRPTLTVTSAAASGPFGALIYTFEIALDPTFGSRIVVSDVDARLAQTTLTLPADLAINTLHYWRARVRDPEVTGAWSAIESFLTPLAVVVTPPPGPTGPPGNGNCASSDPEAIVACVSSSYPSYRAAGVSSSQREANMEFLRDRMIEAGICGGLDLAWNLKRGVGPHSIDALAWRTGGVDEVVDVGAAFDDTSSELRLQWSIVGGPPGYDRYEPRPTCGG